MSTTLPYTIFPLGDTAVCIDFGNRIDPAIHAQVMALYYYFQVAPVKGVTDLVPAYSSLTLHYDPVVYWRDINSIATIADTIQEKLAQVADVLTGTPIGVPKTVQIPVCYEGYFAPDLPAVAMNTGLDVQEIIERHTAVTYRVYMLGFLPGFAYMGQVDEAIAQPRKQRPQPTYAGGVGIAGRQTGIYPLASPGGWQIIGHTPVKLFNKDSGDTLLQPGDSVQFYPVTSYEFNRY